MFISCQIYQLVRQLFFRLRCNLSAWGMEKHANIYTNKENKHSDPPSTDNKKVKYYPSTSINLTFVFPLGIGLLCVYVREKFRQRSHIVNQFAGYACTSCYFFGQIL